MHLQELGRYTTLLQGLLFSRSLINKLTHSTIDREHGKHLDKTEDKLLDFGVFKTFKNIVNGFMMHILSISAFTTAAFLLYQGEIAIGVGVAALGYVESFIISDKIHT